MKTIYIVSYTRNFDFDHYRDTIMRAFVDPREAEGYKQKALRLNDKLKNHYESMMSFASWWHLDSVLADYRDIVSISITETQLK